MTRGQAAYKPLDPEEAGSPSPEEAVRCPMVEKSIFRKHAKAAEDIDELVIPIEDVRGALLDDLMFESEVEWEEFLSSCDLNNDTHIEWKEFQLMVNTLLVSEAQEFTKEAERRIEALQAAMQDWDKANAAAVELRAWWQKVTPRKFIRWFQALDDPEKHLDRIRMLDSLVFTVPFVNEKNRWQAGAGNRQHISFGKYKGDVMAHDDVVVIASPTEFPLPQQKPMARGMKIDFKRTINMVDNFLLGQTEAPYSCAFTSVGLFDPSQLPFIVREIENASVESRVFDTPIVNAILTVGWHRSQVAFYFNVAVDVLVIVLLSRFAVDARNKKMACPLSVGALMLCSAYHFIGDVVEFFMPVFRPGGSTRDNTRASLKLAWQSIRGSFWSCFEVGMSTYFFFLCVAALTFHWRVIVHGDILKPHRAEWFYHHPMWLVALLAAKTTHLIIKLLSVRALGQRIVPAYDSMTHASSKAFLCFLLIMYFNVVLTFHAVPIKIYDPTGDDARWWDAWENLFDVFVLQFHGVFLGESSPGDLEQENQRIELLEDHGSKTGQISGPSTHTSYHHGVQLLNMGYMVLIHIIMLNVYIGVLSDRYTKAVKRQREHFEKFRAVFTRKTVTRWMFCMKRRFRRQQGDGALHHWIAYKRREFRDPGALRGSTFVMKLLRVVEKHVEEKFASTSKKDAVSEKAEQAAARKRLEVMLSSIADTLELL